MVRIFALIVSFWLPNTLICAPPARWDALPTVSAHFLVGSYAGQEHCPMCMHGYDAGLLWFVSESDTARVASDIDALQTSMQTITGPRFRVFVVLMSARPDSVMIARLSNLPSNWHVARLVGDTAQSLQRDFGMPAGRSQAFWFAQRRILTQETSPTSAAKKVRYALEFLAQHYGTENPSRDPDSPKGNLWLAPARLSNTLNVDSSAARHLCFLGRVGRAGNALVSLITQARGGWARTDAKGCIAWQGPDTARFSLDELDQPTATVPWSAANSGLFRGHYRHSALGTETILGPCEGCELVFRGMPSALSHLSSMPRTQTGEALALRGTVRNRFGVPMPNVILYMYQTDAHGKYPGADQAQRHGTLRAWALTDAQGNYGFDTIRPGAYPAHTNRDPEPAHIHMHILEPGRCSYYVDDMLFADDPLLTSERKAKAVLHPRAGSGLSTPVRNDEGIWQVQRDLVLGLNVENYQDCER